jgi:predicted transcriptional regulator of viral defense system
MQRDKHITKIKDFIGKTPVFLSKDIERIVKDKNYAHLILNKLTKKEKIFRLTKGFYSTFNDPTFSVFCFKPSYLGLYEALSLRNLWEQEVNTTIITIKKVRTGVRKILGTNVIIKRIKPEYFFGFDYIKYGNFYIPVSDLEKTLIDLVYFKEPLTWQILRNLKNKIDKKKMLKYLKSYPKNFQKLVLDKIKI